MISRLRVNTGILPPAQLRLWPKLAGAAQLGFVLYGGTAIALRLGHRQSVDFDFFASAPLDREAIMSSIPDIAQCETLRDERRTLSLRTPEGVYVSFFGDLTTGRVGDPEMTDAGIAVASLADLLATKTKVILQRAEAKDYRDIAALVRAGVSLPAALSAARAMYGSAFNPRESLKAMVYFGDGDLESLPDSDKSALITAVGNVRSLPPVTIRSRQLCAQG
ncbi:MAG: nucleotidyl transferase AbiEii/AbiGii toxin family protein [Hyphomicrobiales bacterium]|nr:nucleotidyl transferase AbiEii/AbiGii toxin family protein [Hyphomicrobiales bacterium]